MLSSFSYRRRSRCRSSLAVRDHHTCTSHQIECRTLRAADLPGNARCAPQTGFGIARTQGLQYDLVIIEPKCRLIKQRDQNSRLRLEDGIHAWQILPPAARSLQRSFHHSPRSARAASGINDASARIACLALAKR